MGLIRFSKKIHHCFHVSVSCFVSLTVDTVDQTRKKGCAANGLRTATGHHEWRATDSTEPQSSNAQSVVASETASERTLLKLLSTCTYRMLQQI
jgi:hypothetical protein